MRYRNARDVLPEELLAELQKYAEGELIYIPGRQQQKAGWGTRNGSRERYQIRNHEMMGRYLKGETIEQISRQFYLSKDSVKKIIKSNIQA